MNRIC